VNRGRRSVATRGEPTNRTRLKEECSRVNYRGASTSASRSGGCGAAGVSVHLRRHGGAPSPPYALGRRAALRVWGYWGATPRYPHKMARQDSRLRAFSTHIEYRRISANIGAIWGTDHGIRLWKRASTPQGILGDDGPPFVRRAASRCRSAGKQSMRGLASTTPRGRLTRTTDSAGNVATRADDANGNRTESTDPQGGPTAAPTTHSIACSRSPARTAPRAARRSGNALGCAPAGLAVA
jgi:YD repeat-containing protein